MPKAGLGRRDETSGILTAAEAIENQVLEEPGHTGSERDRTKGGRRAAGPPDLCMGITVAGLQHKGKGAGRPGPAEDGKKMSLSRRGEICQKNISQRSGSEAAEDESLETAAESSPVAKGEQKALRSAESERRLPMKPRPAPRERRGAR